MTWEWINLASPDFAQPSEPPITCDLIYRGKRHALTGPPEAAKTLAGLILGLEHMRAGHGPFLLVDFEMGEHATRRMLDDLGATIDEIKQVWYATPDGPPQFDEIQALIAAEVGLVIIDAAAGAYGVSGLDDNKRADAERFGRLWVEPLWQARIATLLLDHVVKNSEARGRWAIGSERKLGTVDVALGLEAVKQLHRGGTGLIRISVHKDRPGHLPRPRAGELELVSDPDTHAISWTFRAAAESSEESSNGFRPTVLMDRVLDHVNVPWYEPVTKTELAGALRGKRTYLFQAIDVLLGDGRLALKDGNIVPKFPSSREFPAVPGNPTTEDAGTKFPSSHPLQGELGTGNSPEHPEEGPGSSREFPERIASALTGRVVTKHNAADE